MNDPSVFIDLPDRIHGRLIAIDIAGTVIGDRRCCLDVVVVSVGEKDRSDIGKISPVFIQRIPDSAVADTHVDQQRISADLKIDAVACGSRSDGNDVDRTHDLIITDYG